MTDKKQNEIELSEQTRQLFDAPWKVTEYCSGTVTVRTQKDFICRRTNDEKGRKYINRIARLPELYDVLFETAMETCSKCVARHSHIGIVAPAGFDFFAGDCPFENKDYDDDPCRMRQRWKLLGKVRDGK